jgi:hypothetical protein
MANAFKDIISQLQKQKIAIERAIAALQEVGDDTGPKTGSSERRTAKKSAAKKASAKSTGRKRIMSPEARKRISDAVRKRWAAVKKAAKKAPEKRTAA